MPVSKSKSVLGGLSLKTVSFISQHITWVPHFSCKCYISFFDNERKVFLAFFLSLVVQHWDPAWYLQTGRLQRKFGSCSLSQLCKQRDRCPHFRRQCCTICDLWSFWALLSLCVWELLWVCILVQVFQHLVTWEDRLQFLPCSGNLRVHLQGLSPLTMIACFCKTCKNFLIALRLLLVFQVGWNQTAVQKLWGRQEKGTGRWSLA